ncbi:hypothetical protein B296_00041952 [Ensete ventricosum]|uniref:Uncharacterized protein n=1 Tax=Ensete ventricosum TaxID=4639 RepID=A0A426YAG5_ENSVE|nr:hypothetical protein B296_00041952 [Ensete ventricosum]
MEPVASVEEPEGQAESLVEAGMSVFVRPRSMKDLCGTKVRKDDVGYYALYMSDLAQQDPNKEMRARWENLRNYSKMTLFDRVHDAGRLITFMDYRINNLLQKIETLKAGGGPEVVAVAEERVAELEKTQQERTKALQRLESSHKESNEVRGDLSEARKQLKEARVRARKAEDDLLKSVKDLESTRAELPKRAVNDYKESVDFKEGLKRMGRVTYEYGYWVTIARLCSSYPDSKVEEDPFTVRPEDDLMPMERQQAFDDSDPPES